MSPARTCGSVEWRQADALAAVEQRTDGALRPPCDANLPAVMNQPVGEIDPFGLGNELHQVLLDLFRVGALRQPEQVADPFDVCVDHDSTGNSKGRPQKDVGRFSSHAR